MGLVPRILTWLSSLHTRLLILVLLAVLPAFVLAYCAGQERQQQGVEQARLLGLQYAKRASTIQSESIQSAHQLLASLASLPAMRNSGPISCDFFTAELVKQYPFYGTIGVIDTQGNVVCQSPPQKISQNLTADPYFQHVVQSPEIIIGEYGIGSALGEPAIEFAVLISDELGKPYGAVFATLKTDWFDSFASEANLPNTSTLIVANHNNALVFHYPNGEKLGTQSVSSTQVARMIRTSQESGLLQLVDTDRVERLYTFAPLFVTPTRQIGAVGIGLPTEVVYQQANEEFRRNVLLLLGVAGIVMTVAWVFGDWFFLRGIRTLAQATQQLGTGDLGVRAQKQFAGGELNELAHRFNLMAETLQQRDTERKENEMALQRWADIFQNTSVGIMIASADGSRIEEVNPAYAEMHGYTIAEMNGMRIEDVHAPESRLDLENHLDAVGQLKHHMYETKHLRKNGTPFPVLVDATVVTDLEGTILYRIANVQDLTYIKHAEQTEREQRAFVESLQDTAAALTSTLDFDTVLDRILDNVERVVPHSATNIMLIESRVARVVRSRGFRERGLEDWLLALRMPIDEFPLIRRVTLTNKPCLVLDTQTCSDWVSLPQDEWIRSVILMPLSIKDKTIGILDFTSDAPNFFNETHVTRLQAFADQAAIALENARLLQQAGVRADQLALLYDAGLALNSVLDPKTQIEFLLKISMRALNADRGEFFRWDATANHVRLEMLISTKNTDQQDSLEGATFSLGEERGIVGLVAEQRLPVNIGNLRQDQRWIPADPILNSGLWVPIQHQQEFLAVICLFSRQVNAFSNKDERLLVLFANQVAVAMENARLFEAQNKRAREIETLRQASLRATSTLELPQVLEEIISYTLQLFAGDDAHIFLYDGESLNFAAAKWADGVQREPFQPRPQGLSYTVARHGERIVVPDQRKDPLFANTNWEGAIVGVPLKTGTQVRGVMNIAFRQPRSFSQEELQVLDLMADQAAIAIENARLFNETRQRADRLTLLNRIARVINQTLDLDDLLRVVYQEISNALHMEAFYIALYDETTEEIDYRIRYDLGKQEPPARRPLIKGWGRQVVQTKKPVLIRDSEKENRLSPAQSAVWGSMQVARSWLGVPIMSGSSIVGIISIQSYSPNAYSDEDERLLMTIADQVSAAIQTARLFAETRRQLGETEAINRLSNVMRTAIDVTEMVTALMDESLALMNTQAGEVLIFNSFNELEENVARGWFAALPKGPLQPSGGISWRVFSTGEEYACREYVTDPLTRETSRPLIPANWGGVAIPIGAGQQVFGVLQVAVELPRMVNAHETNLLKTLVEITANAIQRARLRAQTEIQVRRLNSLHIVDTAINGSLDLRVTLDIILDQVTAQLSLDAADILVLNPYDQSLSCAARRGFRSAALTRARLLVGGGYPSRAILESQAVSFLDVKENDSDPRAKDLAGEGFIAYAATALVTKGQVCGVLEAFNRTPLRLTTDMREFLQTLGGQAAIALENISTFDRLQKSSTELMFAYDSTIEAWARILDTRHREHPNHTQQIAEMTVRLAQMLGVPDQDIVNIRRGALLHSTGKISIPEQILFKTQALTQEEQDLLRQHPAHARDFLSAIPYLQTTLDIPYYQDECWDGSGTPKGLFAEQIPFAARVFSIVHTWVEMRYGNLQNAGHSAKETREYIRSQSGKQFDPNIVPVFFRLLDSDWTFDK